MRNPFQKSGLIRRSEVEISPEEVFMDSVNIPGFRHEMHEGRIERPIPRRSFLVFASAIVLALLLLIGRLVDLGIVRGVELSALAQANKTYPILIQAPRGIFYDRNSQKLVVNDPTFAIAIAPQKFSDDESFSHTLGRIAGFLGKTLQDIADENDLGKSQDPHLKSSWPEEVFVASGDLTDAVLEIQAHQEDFPHVTIEETNRRNYRLGDLAAHLLGYVGSPSKQELSSEPDLRFSDLVGKSGLELQYQRVLNGTPGEKIIEIDARGKPQRERYIEEASSGNDVELEIDAGLQAFAASTLARHITALGKRAGAIVALDPRDGAVRAIASYPTFDPNIFQKGLSRRDFERIIQNPDHPLFNRAISGAYPSGSTIKPLMATAALEEHLIDPAKTINDIGYISVPNPYDKAHPTIFKDWKALGIVDMRRAIAWSANVYFYSIGGGYGDIPGLGIERIGAWLAKFGWGAKLGIDLPGENAGLIPSPANKKITRPKDPVWRIGDTYISSIGQGDLEMNPLQLASAFAAIANNGTLWRPRLAKAVVDQDRHAVSEFKPQAVRTDIASGPSLQIVREGMRQAVTSGSARRLADLPFSVAGKTGTAQTGAYGKNHGWFGAFAPYENPELAIAILVEQGTGGEVDAVPMAKEILYYYFTQHHNGMATGTPQGGQ